MIRHEHTFQETQQSLDRSIQSMQNSFSRVSEHVAQLTYASNTEEISCEPVRVEDASTLNNGEKIVLEDEQPTLSAEDESHELTTMIIGDAVPMMEEFPIEHIEISFTLEEPQIITLEEKIKDGKEL